VRATAHTCISWQRKCHSAISAHELCVIDHLIGFPKKLTVYILRTVNTPVLVSLWIQEGHRERHRAAGMAGSDQAHVVEAEMRWLCVVQRGQHRQGERILFASSTCRTMLLPLKTSTCVTFMLSACRECVTSACDMT
jgi:hypothetical protein